MVERAPDLADLNPEFSSRLDAFKAALDKASIGYTINSGYRSPEYQDRMYANHLAKQAGQPLPYPNDEAPDVVAPAWRSFHNYGLATDFTLTNPADYARLRSMAPQFGLSGIGASDPGHIQLSGTLADDINQYHLASWRPSSQPAPASGAIAYNAPLGQPSRPGTPTPGTPVNDFYHTAMTHESRGKNIANAEGTSSASGYYQITQPTWDSIRAARPELNLPAKVLDASPDQQTAAYHSLTSQNVAALQGANLPINDKNVFMASFLGGGGATKFLSAMGQSPDASAAAMFPKEAEANRSVFYDKSGQARSLSQVYALQTGSFGPSNTTGFGPDAAAAPAAASGAPGTAAGPPNPFTAFAPGGAAAPGGAVATSLTNLDKALGGQQPGKQQQGGQALDMQPSPMIPGPGAVNVSPLFNPMLGQQMMAQLSRAPARPAQQEPMGTTLNSMAMLDTSPVQFPQVYPSQMGYGGSGYGMGSMSMSGYPSSGGYSYGG